MELTIRAAADAARSAPRIIVVSRRRSPSPAVAPR